MKKLMIMACVIAVAAISQAAQIKWSTGNYSWKNVSGGNPAMGSTVYLINGDTALATIAAAIDSTTGAFDTSVAWYYDTGTTGNAKGAVNAKETANLSSLTKGTEYNFSALVIEKTADGVKYMVSDTFAQTAYDPGDTPNTIAFGSDTFGANSQTYDATSAPSGWAAVPEPTSGLLLLLGMAGLALRRRRA